MAIKAPGIDHEIVWNGSEYIFTWTDDTALADEAVVSFGVDPEAEAAPGGRPLPQRVLTGCFKGCF